MAARIIDFYNQASSQGKTVFTLNVGYHLAELGRKVLLVDMDSHAWLTECMGISSPDQLDVTVADTLMRDEPTPILGGFNGMDLIPANENLGQVDNALEQIPNAQFKLRSVLEKLANDYDYILIDSPPQLGLLSIMGLAAATHVLVPVVTNPKGWRGLEQFVRTYHSVVQKLNRDLKIVGIMPNMCRFRTDVHETFFSNISELCTDAGIFQFRSIPLFTDMDKSWYFSKPLAAESPKHTAVAIFRGIAQHLEEL